MTARPDTAALPMQVDGARRRTLLAWDDWSTVWSGRDVNTGRQLRLRLIAPHLRASSAACTQLTVPPSAAGVLWPEARLDGAWPHLRLDLPGPSLDALLPLDEPLDPLLSAQALCAGLSGLQALQAGGLLPSGPLRSWLFFDGAQLRAGWLGDTLETAPIDAVVRLAWDLSQDSPEPLATMVRGWRSHPPPDLDSAAELVVRTLHDQLASSALRLDRRAHHASTMNARDRLATAISALAAVLSPPVVHAELPAEPAPITIESDGQHITLTQDGAPELVYSRRAGLSPTWARLALRTWTLAGRPAPIEPLMRWLRGMSRLRVAQLLVSR